MPTLDNTDAIRDAVAHANKTHSAVQIQAGNSKNFYGNTCTADTLDVRQHSGIIDYEPSELYITARCGTALQEIESVLDEQNQMLQFEPPHFGDNATLGGTVACGLSGPRRPYTGSVRDSVLGVHIVNGLGEHLRFGGQVMKNVAGYDVARLMCGALGTLGIILQVSLKVIPKPRAEMTLCFEYSEDEALGKMNQWTQIDLPISATYFENNTLYVRVAGIESTLRQVQQNLGGEKLENGKSFWHAVKEHQREFFNKPTPLWRLSLPCDCPTPAISDAYVIEWNGGLRWLKTDESRQNIFSAAAAAGGNAILFNAKNSTEDCFQPLNSSLIALQTNIKQAFDPNNILNPGKMNA